MIMVCLSIYKSLRFGVGLRSYVKFCHFFFKFVKFMDLYLVLPKLRILIYLFICKIYGVIFNFAYTYDLATAFIRIGAGGCLTTKNPL
jgi:hypothetical protein